MNKPLNSDDLVDRGEKFHKAGRLLEAEAHYRQALAIDASHPGACYFLAAIAYEDGRLEFAKQLVETLLREEPNDAEAWYLSGLIALKQEDLACAGECFKKALAIQPAYSLAAYNLGGVLWRQGDLDAALTAFQRAATLNPQFAEAYWWVGNILSSQSKFDEAMLNYQRAIKTKPNFQSAYENIGGIFLSQGKVEDAMAIYRQAIAQSAGGAPIYVGLGTAYTLKNQYADAAVNFEKALAVDPNCIAAYTKLGDVLIEMGRIDDAAAILRRAIALAPRDPFLVANLSKASYVAGNLEEAIACARQAIALKPDFVELYSTLLYFFQFRPDLSREKLFAEHLAFAERFEAPLRNGWPIYRTADPQKRLRIGFVSGDFRSHPASYFLGAVLSELRKRDMVDIVLYSANAMSDAVTERLRATAHRWQLVSGLADDAVAQRIRDDEIDILIDLSGHTALNRLLVFARKPAPIQVTWLGYWETTGLQAMDYIICDEYSVPDNEQNYYVEKPWRLPHTRLCFSLPEETVPVAPLPAVGNGCVTFGCFNNLAKISDQVVAVWARILKRIPTARFMLKSQSFADAKVRQAMIDRFMAEGVSADRLLLEFGSPRRDYLAAYNRIDIALDPFPFPGGTTSFEGIWMGVPMITLRGDRIISRQGESILSNIGLRDWIAQDEDDYVELAVRKAGDLAELATLRSQLRARLEASPLCDAELFARNLENAFRQMWEKHCERSRS